MSPRRPGLYRQLVVMLVAMFAMIAVAGIAIDRWISGDSLREQTVKGYVQRLALADALILAIGADRLDIAAPTRERFQREAPRLDGTLQPFWREVAEDIARRLPGREVRIEPSVPPVVYIATQGHEAGWIALPEPFPERREGRGFTALVATLLIVLASAAWYARRIVRPLRGLAAAAPEVAAGFAPPPLPRGAARELHDLAAALDVAAQRAREASQARDLMLASLSHDMRTPLARLRLAVELVDVEAATREGWHADIDELDALIGRGIVVAREGPDEPAVACDLVALAHRRAEAHGRAGASWALEHDGACVALAAPVALQRALDNLMDNARVHGAAPFVLRVSTRGARACLEVLDRGGGVDQGLLGALGRPFLRSGPVDAVERSGLDLAGASHAIERCGGSLAFFNREDGGFAVVIDLPLARGAQRS